MMREGFYKSFLFPSRVESDLLAERCKRLMMVMMVAMMVVMMVAMMMVMMVAMMMVMMVAMMMVMMRLQVFSLSLASDLLAERCK